MAPPEVKEALKASFEILKGEFGDIIAGMGAIDLLRGDILDFTYNLSPEFLRHHGRIVNLLRKQPNVGYEDLNVEFGSYYLFETEDGRLFIVFNVASRFAFVVYVKLGTVQMGIVLKTMLKELRDILTSCYDEEKIRRIERIFGMK